jgi:hypothetical protein
MMDRIKAFIQKYETWLILGTLLMIADMYNSS